MVKRFAVVLALCAGSLAWGQLSPDEAAKRMAELNRRAATRPVDAEGAGLVRENTELKREIASLRAELALAEEKIKTLSDHGAMATRPATGLTEVVTSIEKVIHRMPKSVRPQRGEAWNPILIDKANAWLSTELVGKTYRGSPWLIEARPEERNDKKIISARMRYPTVGRGLLGEPIYGKFMDGGQAFIVEGMSGEFDVADADHISRIRASDAEDSHGDPVPLTGVITRTVFQGGSIILWLTDCRITR